MSNEIVEHNTQHKHSDFISLEKHLNFIKEKKLQIKLCNQYKNNNPDQEDSIINSLKKNLSNAINKTMLSTINGNSLFDIAFKYKLFNAVIYLAKLLNDSNNLHNSSSNLINMALDNKMPGKKIKNLTIIMMKKNKSAIYALDNEGEYPFLKACKLKLNDVAIFFTQQQNFRIFYHERFNKENLLKIVISCRSDVLINLINSPANRVLKKLLVLALQKNENFLTELYEKDTESLYAIINKCCYFRYVTHDQQEKTFKLSRNKENNELSLTYEQSYVMNMNKEHRHCKVIQPYNEQSIINSETLIKLQKASPMKDISKIFEIIKKDLLQEHSQFLKL